MILNMTGGGGGSNKSQIIVTVDTGSTVTCSNGEIVKTASEVDGTWTFKGLDLGTWTVTATKDGVSIPATQTVLLERQEIVYLTMSYKTPLLENGIISDEAGGWKNVVNCTFSGGEIKATQNTSTGNYGCFVNKIDVTDYSTLKFKMKQSVHYTDNPTAIGLSTKMPNTTYYIQQVNANEIGYVSMTRVSDKTNEWKEYSIDISNLTGGYYFSIVSIATFAISEIWLDR